MKMKTVGLTLALTLMSAALSFAGLEMGTWKLNEAKSKFPPGAPKNHKVVYTAKGDSIKVTVDGVDGEGKPAHNEWTGKFDGHDYPLVGDPSFDSRSYKKVNDRTLEMTIKKGGKVVVTGKVEMSADGKTRTVWTKGKDAKGKKTESMAFYDKK